jgi:hypothetical protein
MVPVTIYALIDNYASNNEYWGIASTYIYRTLLHEYGWDEVVLLLVCFQLYLYL